MNDDDKGVPGSSRSELLGQGAGIPGNSRRESLGRGGAPSPAADNPPAGPARMLALTAIVLGAMSLLMAVGVVGLMPAALSLIPLGLAFAAWLLLRRDGMAGAGAAPSPTAKLVRAALAVCGAASMIHAGMLLLAWAV